MNETLGMMNWATNRETIGAILNFSHGNPGTLCVVKQTSEKNGIGHVAWFLSSVVLDAMI